MRISGGRGISVVGGLELQVGVWTGADARGRSGSLSDISTFHYQLHEYVTYVKIKKARRMAESLLTLLCASSAIFEGAFSGNFCASYQQGW